MSLQKWRTSSPFRGLGGLTDADGNIAQHIEYIPYGEVFVEERNNSFSTNYLFNAKELDNETGLYYYGARYLDPTGAMWLSVDPVFHAGTSPYAYCLGNPVKMVDPDGRNDIYINPTTGNVLGEVENGETNYYLMTYRNWSSIYNKVEEETKSLNLKRSETQKYINDNLKKALDESPDRIQVGFNFAEKNTLDDGQISTQSTTVGAIQDLSDRTGLECASAIVLNLRKATFEYSDIFSGKPDGTPLWKKKGGYIFIANVHGHPAKRPDGSSRVSERIFESYNNKPGDSEIDRITSKNNKCGVYNVEQYSMSKYIKGSERISMGKNYGAKEVIMDAVRDKYGK